MARIRISEKKKDDFIKACEDLDPLMVLPDKILQAQRLIETLKKDEIEADMLYKCGCPYDWVADSEKYCHPEKGKPKKPHYSNECSMCWIKNKTEEVQESIPEYDYHELSARLNNFEKFRLSPEQLEEILTILEWNKTYDFDSFVKKISAMKSI